MTLFSQWNAASKEWARAYINNIDETIFEYYQVFAKRINRFLPSINGELLFATVDEAYPHILSTSTLNKRQLEN